MMRINGKLVGNFLTEGMITALPDWFVVLGKCGSGSEKEMFMNKESVVRSCINTAWPQEIVQLCYVPGNISYVTLDKMGQCAMSSQFTGCLMSSFWLNKTVYGLPVNKQIICHIANGDDIVNGECIAKVNKLIPDNISFKPSLIINLPKWGDDYQNACNKLGYIVKIETNICGIITEDNELFSFIIGQKNSDNKLYVMAWCRWEVDGKNQRMVEALAIDDELNTYWG